MFSVYRFYNPEDLLLYVGMSENVICRILTHKSDKQWFSEIATIKISKFSSKAEMLEAERRAIASEHPLYNKLIPKNITKKTIHGRRPRWLMRARERKEQNSVNKDVRSLFFPHDVRLFWEK